MFSADDQIKFDTNIVYHISAGGYLFCKKESQVFVALIKDHDGKIVIPKGHLKKDEIPEEAALREIKEELNITETPTLSSYIDKIEYSFSMPDDKREHKKQLYIYAFTVPSMCKLAPQTVEGITEANWVEITDALNNVSFNRDVLEKAIQIVNL